MARRRELNVFSLSFLDIMSCGFGAVILIYIIINHSTESESQDTNKELLSEVYKIEQMVEEGREQMIVLKNSLNEKEDETVTSEALAIEIIETIKELRAQLAELETQATQKDKSITQLKEELKKLEEDSEELKGSVGEDESSGRAVRSFAGEGDRQYLTGMKVGGSNILILMDASASMLAEKIVNVIRMRNMSKEKQLASTKWQRAIRTVEWVTANIPNKSEFQLYTFNTDVSSAVPDTRGEWLKAVDGVNLDLSIEKLKQTVPSKGTSLVNAFDSISELKPMPDNIFLIVDSLPTQADQPPRGTTVESKVRVRHFEASLEKLPVGIPINVILFPMEGDPLATPTYWQLAQFTGGSFLSPPPDWP
jgi:hypothetical protein